MSIKKTLLRFKGKEHKALRLDRTSHVSFVDEDGIPSESTETPLTAYGMELIGLLRCVGDENGKCLDKGNELKDVVTARYVLTDKGRARLDSYS